METTALRRMTARERAGVPAEFVVVLQRKDKQKEDSIERGGRRGEGEEGEEREREGRERGREGERGREEAYPVLELELELDGLVVDEGLLVDELLVVDEGLLVAELWVVDDGLLVVDEGVEVDEGLLVDEP